MKQKFFKCELCGNLLGLIENSGITPACCGQNMTELVPNTVDASVEKHVPAVQIDGDTVAVSVGSAAHPMEENHRIQFVYLETEKGGQRKSLAVGSAPFAKFMLTDDKPVAVYSYCNLHGLWKSELFKS